MSCSLIALISLMGSAACMSAPQGATAQDTARPTIVEEMIASGRVHLDARQAEMGQALFEQALDLRPGDPEIRMWVLRAWMDLGRSNDSLDAIDALSKEGFEGPGLDYLYGMAFARRAEGLLASGVRDASIQMNFTDAVTFLSAAAAADGDRFYDAFLPLARSAWYSQDLVTARTAAEEATQRMPDSSDSHYVLGRVALSQFAAWKGALAEDEEPGEEIDASWELARKSLQVAVNLLPDAPRDEELQRRLSRAHLHLGHTLMWKEMRPEALAAYGSAITWAPEEVDFAQLWSQFGAEAITAFQAGSSGFEKHFGKTSPRDSTLLWWLGFARLESQDPGGAEQAFLASLKKAPEFVNAWFYVGLSRYAGKNYSGAVDAFSTGWNADPATIVAAVEQDAQGNLARLEFLVGWSAGKGRLTDAARISEICAESARIEPRHWNNMGLFLRDAAEAMQGSRNGRGGKSTPASRAILERSLAAYMRALDLVPDDPQLLNDAAVMLHYYLKRDLEQALQMYADAQAGAEKALAGSGLSAERRSVLKTAERDAGNNHRILRRALTRGKKRDAKDGEKPSPDGR